MWKTLGIEKYFDLAIAFLSLKQYIELLLVSSAFD